MEHLEQHDPKSFDLEGARVDLEASVAARGHPAVGAHGAVGAGRNRANGGGALGRGGAVARVGGVDCRWLVDVPPPQGDQLRRRLIDLVEQRVRAIATSRLIAAEVGLIKTQGPMWASSSIRAGYAPDGACRCSDGEHPAYDVHRIWLKLKASPRSLPTHQLALAA